MDAGLASRGSSLGAACPLGSGTVVLDLSTKLLLFL